MSEKIVVCLEKGGARDMAEAFSRRTNTPISEKPGEHLTVLFNSKGVSNRIWSDLSGRFREYASPGDPRKITA